MMKQSGFPAAAMTVAMMMAILLWVTVGCGIKAPPQAPLDPLQGLGITLEAVRDKNVVQLSWDAGAEKAGLDAVKEYEVYVDASGPEDAPCDGCPQTFELAGRAGAGERYYRFSALPGFRYVFKIRAAGQRTFSPFSNSVEVAADDTDN